MANLRKSELNNFLNFIPENHLVGVYYLDKSMNIVHYFIYSYADLDVLKEKLKKFGDELENDMIKILLWKESESEEYLTGVYDGIIDGSIDFIEKEAVSV